MVCCANEIPIGEKAMRLCVLMKRQIIPKMDNPEKLTTLGTQDDVKQNKNNPEKLTTLGTQDDVKPNKNTTQ